MVRDTSLNAYIELNNTDKLSQYQRKVYKVISQHGNVTDKEISEITRMQINNVTGRRNELLKLGMIEDNGKRKCKITGRTVYQWNTS